MLPLFCLTSVGDEIVASAQTVRDQLLKRFHENQDFNWISRRCKLCTELQALYQRWVSERDADDLYVPKRQNPVIGIEILIAE